MSQNSKSPVGFTFIPADPNEGRMHEEIRLYWEEDVPSLLYPPPKKERRAFGVSIPCALKPLAGGVKLSTILIARKDELISLLRAEPGINDEGVSRAVMQIVAAYRAGQPLKRAEQHDNG